MTEESMPYSCAVVEVEPGKFIVTYPGDVSQGGLIEYNYEITSTGSRAVPRTTTPGKYANHSHLYVNGGKKVPTIEQFRENVGSVVNQLMAEATPEKPVTLDAIKEALPAQQYHVRVAKGIADVLKQYLKTDVK